MTHDPPRPDVDPVVKALVDALPLAFTRSDGVEVARQKYASVTPPPELLQEMRIEQRTIRHDALPDIPVRVYWPPTERRVALPVVVYYHGGGWALGDLDGYDHVARAHAAGAEAVVVSVDYRLAPEHPFPAGVDDAWAALQWVADHAATLGADPARIAVAGDSAGANLAAVTALRARDESGPPLRFQLLWYPVAVLDFGLPSFVENRDAPILNRDVIEALLAWYVPGLDVSDRASLPVHFAPANAETLAGLAPAYIGTAEHDPLRDDGRLYAEMLRAAGVPVQSSNEPTMVHGFVSLALLAPAAAEATARGLAAMRAALHAVH